MATLQLLNVNYLNNTYQNTLDFESLSAQTDFFDKLVFTSMDLGDDYTYIREHGSIMVDYPKEQLEAINYLRFRNTDKWWYAFITSKNYVNENVTEVNFEIDVMQTFLFEHSLEKSFVLREHQDRFDNEGNYIFNLTTENIEAGYEFEKISDNEILDNVSGDLSPDGNYGDYGLYWLTIVTKEPLDKTENTSLIAGLPTNVYTYVSPLFFQKQSIVIAGLDMQLANPSSSTTPSNLHPKALDITALGILCENPNVITIRMSRYSPFNVTGSKTDNVYVISPILQLFNAKLITITNNDVQYGLYKIELIKKDDCEKVLTTKGVTKSVNLETLSINNSSDNTIEPKLLTREFSSYMIEQNGVKQLLDIPLLQDFKYVMRNSFSIRLSQSFMPQNYAGSDNPIEYALNNDSTTDEVPLRTDAWLTYLASNKNALITGTFTDIINLGTGLFAGSMLPVPFNAGAVVQSIGGFVDRIANRMNKVSDLKNTPDEVSKPNFDYLDNFIKSGMFYHEKLFQILPQFKARVTHYLYTFGYKVNDVKKPDLKSRYYFNYIQTQGANVASDIDNEYVDKLKSIYNDGITFWHYRTAETFKGVNNYDYENLEMSIYNKE